MKHAQRGFTLIELLLVLAIISLLATIIVGNLNSSREKARMAKALLFDQNIHNTLGNTTTDKVEFDNSLQNNGEYIYYTQTAFGGPSYVSDGVRGSAIRFDGTYRVDILSDPPRYTSSDSYAISFWFRTSQRATQDWQYIAYSNWGYTNAWYILGPHTDGRIQFSITGKNGGSSSDLNTVFTKDGMDLADGKWHHLLAERDFEKKEISLYIDGELHNTSADGWTSDFYVGTTDETRIGHYFGTTAWNYHGDIDSFHIYHNHI